MSASEIHLLRGEVAELKALLLQLHTGLSLRGLAAPPAAAPIYTYTGPASLPADRDLTPQELAAADAAGNPSLRQAQNKRRRAAMQRKAKGIYKS